MARLLLGVSGGIAAYKALELVRLAMKAGHAVRVIQTEASTRFVGPASFAGGRGVGFDMLPADAQSTFRQPRPPGRPRLGGRARPRPREPRQRTQPGANPQG